MTATPRKSQKHVDIIKIFIRYDDDLNIRINRSQFLSRQIESEVLIGDNMLMSENYEIII